MYAQAAFRMEDANEMISFVKARRFASLVVNAENGPVAAYIPMLCRDDEGGIILEGHVANGNPILEAVAAGAPALAIFTGPDAYVSPSLYPSKREHGRVVPTWNYLAVEARGAVTPFSGAELRTHVEALTDTMEAGAEAPWAVSDAPGDFITRLTSAITGLRMAPASLEGIRKLSQNRPEPDRISVQNAFTSSPNATARALAAEMSRKV
jgi:transcriptional regulator